MSLLRFFPTGILTRLGVYALIFTLGLACGNSYATKAALQRELDQSARRMASNHEQLITWYAGKMKELRLAREQQRGADNSALDIMQKRRADAERGKREAERKLAEALAAIPEPKEPANEILADAPASPGCVMPPSVRGAINAYIDSINSYPDIGSTEADPARLPDGSNSASAPLACAELAASVTDILEHDAMMIAWVLSWQQWANEALR